MAESGARLDDEWEDDTAAEFFDGLTATKGSFTSTGQLRGTGSEYGTPDEEPVVMSHRIDGPRDMFGEEVVALIKNMVQMTRKALQRSLANSGLTGDAAAQTKLTIQLKSQGFREFPEKAIDYLKPDVERLVIAHNSIPMIPMRFSELQSLTFLNMRSNKLREFPKAFLKLSKLQMLDICYNQVASIPDEIIQMKSLKVLSASGNILNVIPYSIGFLEALRILKVDGNPLTGRFRQMIDEAGGFPSGNPQPPQQTQHELDLTTRLKERFRYESARQDSADDSSESPLETPKPLRRNNSIRFPVAVPSLSGSEASPDLTSPRTGSLGKSHQRGISGNSTGYSAGRRPGVAPLLINSNDRIRSNSDGQSQLTPVLRTKRIGLLSKRTPEPLLDPSRLNRNSSHLRGVSYGSALKDRSGPGRSVVRSNLSNGSSISEVDVGQHEVVGPRRLSSLPEADIPDLPGFSAAEVQACKGLLYSLHQMHNLIGGQYNIVRQNANKRSSLERVYYNAGTHLDNLDNALFNMYNTVEEDDQVREDACRTTREGAKSCVVAYKQVVELIFRSADTYVSQTDPRFVRTFLHLLYASIIEAINATANLCRMLDEGRPAITGTDVPPLPKDSAPKLTVRPTTPVKERPLNLPSRLRNDAANVGNIASRRPSHRYKSSSNPYLPLLSTRSRSNSRNLSSVPSSVSGSVETPRSGEAPRSSETPRSGESFYIPNSPGLPTPAQDYNPMKNADFNNQDIIWEQVHQAWSQAANLAAGDAMAFVWQRFRVLQRNNIEARGPRALQDLFSRLVFRAKQVQDCGLALKARLAAVKLKDAEVRRSSEFWAYCTRLANSFVRLISELKACKPVFNPEPSLVRLMRPIHLVVKNAINTTHDSPWKDIIVNNHSLSESTNASPAHSRVPSRDMPAALAPVHGNGGNGLGAASADRLRSHAHTTANISSSNLSARGRGDSETSLSPFLPQTPITAALGPAAQATIPSNLETPPKSSFDTSFRGDVFERADTLLRSQSVLGHRR